MTQCDLPDSRASVARQYWRSTLAPSGQGYYLSQEAFWGLPQIESSLCRLNEQEVPLAGVQSLGRGQMSILRVPPSDDVDLLSDSSRGKVRAGTLHGRHSAPGVVAELVDSSAAVPLPRAAQTAQTEDARLRRHHLLLHHCSRKTWCWVILEVPEIQVATGLGTMENLRPSSLSSCQVTFGITVISQALEDNIWPQTRLRRAHAASGPYTGFNDGRGPRPIFDDGGAKAPKSQNSPKIIRVPLMCKSGPQISGGGHGPPLYTGLRGFIRSGEY